MDAPHLTNDLAFPPLELASQGGPVAVGGDLRVERLVLAYRSGIFPWYEEGQPILWWSPDPRFVLYPDRLKISRSLRQAIRGGRFEVSFDRAFGAVVERCRSVPRRGPRGTWITREMADAYGHLHQAGWAHSVEVWREGRIVGGLYGVSLGRVFCGESMFFLESNASKVGLVALVERLRRERCNFIDCQIYTSHLRSLGAEFIPRARFIEELRVSLRDEG